MLNPYASTQFVVFWPTPGSESRSSIAEGTLPPYLSMRIDEVCLMWRALALKKPAGLISFSISRMGAPAISSGVTYLEKSLFEATSVFSSIVLWDSIVDIRTRKGSLGLRRGWYLDLRYSITRSAFTVTVAISRGRGQVRHNHCIQRPSALWPPCSGCIGLTKLPTHVKFLQQNSRVDACVSTRRRSRFVSRERRQLIILVQQSVPQDCPVTSVLMKKLGRDEIESLVREAKNLDREALSELCVYFYPRIYRYVFYRVGTRQDAEDITSEVFVRMVRSLNTQKGSFQAWLFRIASNLVIDHYRRSARQKKALLNKSPRSH